MTEITIKPLADQVDALIEAHARLKQQNAYLLRRQSELIAENHKLLEQHSEAYMKIHRLLTQLKSLEEQHG